MMAYKVSGLLTWNDKIAICLTMSTLNTALFIKYYNSRVYSVPVCIHIQCIFITSRDAWLWQNYFGQYLNHDYDQKRIRVIYLYNIIIYNI